MRLEDGKAQLRPIAGTRWRGASPKKTPGWPRSCWPTPKSGPNTSCWSTWAATTWAGCASTAPCTCPDLMVVERYCHVMHIVSDVQGQLRPEFDAFDLLRATFPAGTVSGAPKVRAMEIIEELEGTPPRPVRRRVGYFGFDGAMDTCITIRTIVMRGKTVLPPGRRRHRGRQRPGPRVERNAQQSARAGRGRRRAERGLVDRNWYW